MNAFLGSLLNGERVDLARAFAAPGEQAPVLLVLGTLTCNERPLTAHVQAAMDALLDDPPPAATAPGESALRPWWSPMPAAYLAAAFRHVGLADVCSAGARAARLSMPHARESVRVAREVLREEGVPFVVREHVAALIVAAGKVAGLPGSGAPAETYMKLSCSLDLRALYHLERSELRALGCAPDDLPMQRLEAFRSRAEQCGVFGLPRPPPLAPERVRELGFESSPERHRALNAVRYFDLVARMSEPQWFVERLRQEREGPSGRLHLLIGPAGSGKSTYARTHLPEFEVVSTDRMREELTGDPSDQSQNYLVFQRCMDRVRTLLGEGHEVVFDATNCSEALRSMPVQAGRWSGAEVVGYFFDASLTEALRRNQLRPRAVPEDVIRKQYRLLEPPALYEADRHCAVDADGGLIQYWPPPPEDEPEAAP
jgi:predicted kinase